MEKIVIINETDGLITSYTEDTLFISNCDDWSCIVCASSQQSSFELQIEAHSTKWIKFSKFEDFPNCTITIEYMYEVDDDAFDPRESWNLKQIYSDMRDEEEL